MGKWAVPYWPWITLLVVVLLAALCFYQRHKLHVVKMECHLQQQSTAIYSLSETIADGEKERQRLKKEASDARDINHARLGKGKTVFESVMKGVTMRNISIADEQSFVDYYAFAYHDEYARLIDEYTSLSLRHKTYLILLNLGFTDKDIPRILFIQPSTVRNYRLRIKRNMRRKK